MKKLLFILLGFVGTMAILIITISSNLKQSILAYKALSTNGFVVMELICCNGVVYFAGLQQLPACT